MAAEILAHHTDANGNGTETIRVAGQRVACNGGGGALGHPQVWLNLGEEGAIMCPYCSRRFLREGSSGDEDPNGKG